MTDTLPERVMVRFTASADAETEHPYFSAAHVAAEVAAERARCVVPEVVRDAARQKADDYKAYSHENIYPSTALLFQQRAEAVYTWLAALPPITPEGT
jgi:hypothetical protein